MDDIGGQEITMPVVHPADIWKESGRWYEIDAELSRFKDRNGREMVLAMTHEEIIADLVRRGIRSYRQLPQLVYHLQTKWRDDPRPRAGLIRVREFTMKDSYSMDIDWAGLDRQYQAHYFAYFRIFSRCGLHVIAVKADVGIMGGKEAHEFMVLSPIGEDTLLLCDTCGWKANRQVATFQKVPNLFTEPSPLEKIATPDCKSIEDLANFLDIPQSSTAKAVFLTATIQNGDETQEKQIFAVIRGDMDVNETKLANIVGARSLRPSTENEIRSTGAVPGYACPIGLHDVLVVADDLIPPSSNLVAGANELGFHLRNVNFGRDFSAWRVADIASAQPGYGCPKCGAKLHAERGVEVGNIFKLGTRFSDTLGCYFLDAQGQSCPVVMGSYGIGVGRLMACAAELHHDEHGLIWPITIAPYQVHLVVLISKGENSSLEKANQLYSELQGSGIEVLYDDRAESPGVKFNDADLIGIPIRLTVSERALKLGGVEVKMRYQADRKVIPFEQIIDYIKTEIANLLAQLDKNVSLALDHCRSADRLISAVCSE